MHNITVTVIVYSRQNRVNGWAKSTSSPHYFREIFGGSCKYPGSKFGLFCLRDFINKVLTEKQRNNVRYKNG